jgi:hypothetical protein
MYQTHRTIDDGNALFICPECIQWASEILNKPPEPPTYEPGEQLKLL